MVGTTKEENLIQMAIVYLSHKIYKAAAESIDPSQPGYTDEEKEDYRLFSQMNAFSQTFQQGRFRTDDLDDGAGRYDYVHRQRASGY